MSLLVIKCRDEGRTELTVYTKITSYISSGNDTVRRRALETTRVQVNRTLKTRSALMAVRVSELPNGGGMFAPTIRRRPGTLTDGAAKVVLRDEKPVASLPAKTSPVNYPVSNLALEQRPIDEFRSLRVAVIGAGLSGILAGILLPAKVPGIDLTIFEKNQDVVCNAVVGLC
jgi:hypothetical protein